MANLYRKLRVAISLLINSTGCKRSFSAMRQDRFSSLALIKIENSLSKTYATSGKVLDKFCEKIES